VKNIIKNIIIPLTYFAERKVRMSQQLLINFQIFHGRFSKHAVNWWCFAFLWNR